MTVRTRQRGGIQAIGTLQEYAYHTSCAHTSWTPNGASIAVQGGEFETFTDTVVPDFHRRRAAGELFFNSMGKISVKGMSSGSGYHITSVPNTCFAPAWKAEYDGQGNWAWVFLEKAPFYGWTLPKFHSIISHSTIRDLESEVSTQMLSQRGKSDSNLFESLAELDQTIGLFNKPISRLFRTFNQAAQARREGKFTGYTLNGVSNLWLAYRYGIVPLLNDIQAITDGLKKTTALRRETTRAKKGFETSATLKTYGTYGVVRSNVDIDVTESYTVRAMSLDEFNTSLYENLGFTSKNLITLPWELIPYSFVADWFVNIGDYLGAITPAFGWKNLGSAMTTIHGTFNRFRVYGGYSTNPSYVVDVAPNGVYDLHKLERYRGAVRFPDLVIKNDFRFDRPKRVADALALLSQKGLALFSSRPGVRKVI